MLEDTTTVRTTMSTKQVSKKKTKKKAPRKTKRKQVEIKSSRRKGTLTPMAEIPPKGERTMPKFDHYRGDNLAVGKPPNGDEGAIISVYHEDSGMVSQVRYVVCSDGKHGVKWPLGDVYVFDLESGRLKRQGTRKLTEAHNWIVEPNVLGILRTRRDGITLRDTYLAKYRALPKPRPVDLDDADREELEKIWHRLTEGEQDYIEAQLKEDNHGE